MRKTWMLVLTLLLALGLSACGGASETGQAGLGEVPAADGPNAESAADPGGSASPEIGEGGEDGHSRPPSGGDNVVEHEAAVYCGNTATTVSRDTRMGGEPWEASFWGDDSVVLTDLLRYLNYSEDICRCLPEYTVDTEFGLGYGVNLTEGYVRYNDGQVSLTEEQTALIREIIDRQAADGT